MTTIELPTDLAQQLEAEAKRRGTTVDALAVNTLRVQFPPPIEDTSGAGSLADFIRDFVDVVDGSSEPLAENASQVFGDDLMEKHRRGKL